ncbi:MAG: TIGR02757 family protein, partial [Bacteroidales bacterium]|nr:TIGR02757 family protein [Bacteroidales bacterium]
MMLNDLKKFLDQKYEFYNQPGFITSDPVQIPHRFSRKEDIEISAFLTAIIAWGQRKTIINNATRLMFLMDNHPHDFIVNANEKDFEIFLDFKHRTFNGDDAVYFLSSLKNLYLYHGGPGTFFEKKYRETGEIRNCLIEFRKIFFELPHLPRSEKHIANIQKKASAKRLNMFLRWMVRKDNGGVDFGLWNIPASALYIPLDIHTGTVARKLGLLTRKQDDWNAVEELTNNLRVFDPKDPVKYDFALFGLGAFEGVLSKNLEIIYLKNPKSQIPNPKS